MPASQLILKLHPRRGLKFLNSTPIAFERTGLPPTPNRGPIGAEEGKASRHNTLIIQEKSMFCHAHK